MGESGNQRHRGPGSEDDGDMIQFGGLGVRWPFPEVHLPPMLRLPSPTRVSVTITLTALAVGLLAGFAGGRLTAHQAGPKARSFAPASTPIAAPRFATTVVGLTSARCAAQVGGNLELGVEIENETRSSVTLDAIRPMFPLGGLRTVSSGIGPCGELPATEIPSAASLLPGATEWIHTMVAVRVTCPEPLPVWFRVGYSRAGRTGIAVLAGFPDLEPVSYRHCPSTDENASAFIAIAENGRDHSSRPEARRPTSGTRLAMMALTRASLSSDVSPWRGLARERRPQNDPSPPRRNRDWPGACMPEVAKARSSSGLF